MTDFFSPDLPPAYGTIDWGTSVPPVITGGVSTPSNDFDFAKFLAGITGAFSTGVNSYTSSQLQLLQSQALINQARAQANAPVLTLPSIIPGGAGMGGMAMPLLIGGAAILLIVATTSNSSAKK